MESAPADDAVKPVEVSTKDLEYYTNLVVEAGHGLKRLVLILRKVLRVKCSRTASRAIEKSFTRGRVRQCGRRDYLLLRSAAATPTTFIIATPISPQ